MIADLTTMGLPKEAVEARVHAIGGSDANIILSGNQEKILKLWEEKTGRREPEDLTDELMVMMGLWTEAFNAAWFQKQTGLTVTARNLAMTCDVDDWRAATVDGLIGAESAVFEAKHTNPFLKEQEVLAMYMPQLTHNMDVANLNRAYLSVFRGNSSWLYWQIDYDPAYAAEVHKAEWDFWMAVLSDEPPVPYPVPPLPAHLAVKEVDFTGNNAWANAAGVYLDTCAAAKANEAAKDGMKKMIAADVAVAWGHGVEFRRDKRGSLRISTAQEG
jgi:predicted phage-related endonuclease